MGWLPTPVTTKGLDPLRASVRNGIGEDFGNASADKAIVCPGRARREGAPDV
jgi:hypothetical protein